MALCEKRFISYRVFRLHPSARLRKNESYVRIAALAVNASERGKGNGSKLLQAVEDWAIKHDISTIVLNSGNRQERQIANRFYEAAGFVPKATGFYKQL
ncbi:GNAT family N-acetyltransferase [Halalkalibacterium halodurans]|jgi:GNAT superfamily N-acetyltransferase|uniref:GNAT family N-acetyltransferase n=1 Tax=Halalkalibacterium halodurans TaxID=86665 RepID=UPI0009F94FF4|nr:GNAT family N-acetyltransferase [Halalkalibacterium halodurans]TPE69145.1 GNAT family N-acetyltransferase [Halalkalibacterium halodurans]